MSDIGYVHYIFFGGLVFLPINLAVYAFPLLHGMHCLAKRDNEYIALGLFFLSFIISMLMIMYKGRVIVPNGFNKFFFMIFGVYMYFNSLKSFGVKSE
jgi:hypothetical protein